mmetsp:Transcript_12229/g.26222  ORF Transcript_12229/g.26222 Transcript_12229/m.26222 type:complete len:91 (+) Transcript_12229:173-445(+)
MYDQDQDFYKASPFQPNTAFMFAPLNDLTWHNMALDADIGDIERDSFQVNFNSAGMDAGWKGNLIGDARVPQEEYYSALACSKAETMNPS